MEALREGGREGMEELWWGGGKREKARGRIEERDKKGESIRRREGGEGRGFVYVMPNSSVRDCPGEPCLNLHKYIIDGSAFVFLPGNHTAAILPRISNVTLEGESDAVQCF